MNTWGFARSKSEKVWLYGFCVWKPMKTVGFGWSKTEKAWLYCFCGCKPMKTLGFGRSKSEKAWLYRFCAWKPMKTISFGRSKSTTLRFWTAQSQQTCAGAYKRSLQFKATWLVDANFACPGCLTDINSRLLIDLNLQSTNLPCYLLHRSYLSTNLEIWIPPNLQTYKLGKSILHSLVAHKGPADIYIYIYIYMHPKRSLWAQTHGSLV